MSHEEYLRMIEEQGYYCRFIEMRRDSLPPRSLNIEDWPTHVLLVIGKGPEEHLYPGRQWSGSGSNKAEALDDLMSRYPNGRFSEGEVDPYDS